MIEYVVNVIRVFAPVPIYKERHDILRVESNMRKELRKPAPGKLVNVNGHNMHVFSEGQGNETFIFLSGSGTACPVLDFKPLWSLLSHKHRIAVVDRAGYGWSEPANSPRNIDSILSESREALKLAGIEGPYFLVPHSLSGLEALYWAQKYPHEVNAIIGLDPRIPTFEQMPSKFFVKLMRFLGVLSSDMIDEINHLGENAEKIKCRPLPVTTPMYFFISGRNGIKNWEETLVSFLSDFKLSKNMILNCGHYVHRYEYAKIADEVNAFVENVILELK